MKVIALTYNYDLGKLSDIGRRWANNVYKSKEFIFDYSAASYATFIDKNPDQILHIYTDDVQLMKAKMNLYKINQDNIEYYNYSENLEKYKINLRYSFDVLTDFIYFGKSSDDFTVKVDNDLIFYGKLPEPKLNDVFVWKYERLVSQGNPKMGEIKVCEKTIGFTLLPIYNLGVLGIPVDYPEMELRKICDDMVSVDIIDVSDLGVHIWHCAEQTANNWIFYTHKYHVVETHNIVTHYFDNKSNCILGAKYLLKN
jgi:hypothetical protein